MDRRAIVKIVEAVGENPTSYCWCFDDRDLADQGLDIEVAADDSARIDGPKLTWGDLVELRNAIGESECELWLVIPGSRVVTTTLNVTRKEQRYLHRIAPYQLEDDLACDVEEVHFAFGNVIDGTVAIACVDRQWLREQYQAFQSKSLEIVHCIPESLLLPTTQDGWTLRLNKELLVRKAVGEGFAVEARLAQQALAALTAETEEPPQAITLLAGSDSQLQQLDAMVPEHLRENIVKREVSHGWNLNLDIDKTIDLSQGEFARRLPFKRWWRQWRRLAVLGAVALLAYIAVNLVQFQVLKAEQQQMREGIEQVYRQVVPQGAMVDPEKQLQRNIAALQGTTQASYVMPTIAAVTPLLVAAEGVVLKTMNYNDERNEVRLNIQAQTFNAIEQLRVQMEKRGLSAELIGASASNGVHQARLRVQRQN